MKRRAFYFDPDILIADIFKNYYVIFKFLADDLDKYPQIYYILGLIKKQA